MGRIKVSLIVWGVLILTSFIPVIHVMIMYLNGAILSLFNSENDKVHFIVDSVFTTLLLTLFYHSKSILAKIFSALGVILFFLPLLLYATANTINTERYYFLQFLITGFIVGGVLLLIELLKSKTKALK